MILALLYSLVGVVLLIVILYEVFEVLLLPRRARSELRPVRFFFWGTWYVWSGVAVRLSNKRRANFLSLFGPLSMVLLVCLWACCLIAGFGLLQCALSYSDHAPPSIFSQMYMSGTTFFTLGYGDFTPHTAWGKVTAVIEAGTGFGFIAVVIGYLPVLYQLFSQREARVIQLDARAGSPPTAATLLSRHRGEHGFSALDRLLEAWEGWCAQLIESHLSYPMLSYYRSQHDNESWLAALAAIMDACAILLVGLRERQAFQARMTFAIGRLALTELNRVFQMPIRDSDCDRLPSGEFKKLSAALAASDMYFENSDAEEILNQYRATYEPFLSGLSEYLMLPLPSWLGGENDLDNWQNSPRGRTAKRLVESDSGSDRL